MGTVGPRRVGLAEPATVAMKCRRWRRHCGWRTSCSWRACRRETASPGLRSDERGDAGTVMAGTAAAAAEADVSAAAPSSLPSPPHSSYTEADCATTAAAGAAAAGAAAAGAAAALPLPPPQADRRGPSQRANLGPCWGVRRFISPFSWKARSRNCDKPSPSLPIFGCFTTRGAPPFSRWLRRRWGCRRPPPSPRQSNGCNQKNATKKRALRWRGQPPRERPPSSIANSTRGRDPSLLRVLLVNTPTSRQAVAGFPPQALK